jgi:hypothetical protein
MLQRLALYVTLGLVLSALGQSWDTWGFWCVLGLFWASEHVTRREAREWAQAEGVIKYINMSEEEQLKLRRLLAAAEQELKDKSND